MEIHEPQESSRNWASIIERENLNGEDLYDLLDGVMTNQNKLNPQVMPPQFTEENWDPTAVSLR